MNIIDTKRQLEDFHEDTVDNDDDLSCVVCETAWLRDTINYTSYADCRGDVPQSVKDWARDNLTGDIELMPHPDTYDKTRILFSNYEDTVAFTLMYGGKGIKA